MSKRLCFNYAAGQHGANKCPSMNRLNQLLFITNPPPQISIAHIQQTLMEHYCFFRLFKKQDTLNQVGYSDLLNFILSLLPGKLLDRPPPPVVNNQTAMSLRRCLGITTARLVQIYRGGR